MTDSTIAHQQIDPEVPRRLLEPTRDLSGQAKAFAKDVKDKAGEMSADATKLAKEQADQVRRQRPSNSRAARPRSCRAPCNSSAPRARISSVRLRPRRSGPPANSIPPCRRPPSTFARPPSRSRPVADVVRERDMRELVGEVENFARRQPTLFFGGAMILGFAALRFLKSSAPQRGAANEAPSNAFEQRRAS